MEALKMQWYKNRTMYFYGLIGFLGGVAFLVAGILLEFDRHHLPYTLWSFLYLHETEPIVFLLDLAPLVFGFMLGLVGLQRSLFSTISQGKREWETTFDAFPDPVFITNANGDILRCNHAVIDKLNLATFKVIGRPLADILEEGQQKDPNMKDHP